MPWSRVPVLARAALLAAAVLLAGCADLEQPVVEQVASTFAAADPSTRCAMLAPATVAVVEAARSESCVQAMAQLSLPEGAVVSSTVWGDNAQVQLVGDTVFLTRTSTGWKVTAAGCRSRGDAPYVCRLEGP
ncbi:MAG: hypothetical protein QOI36_4020 [Pseudonocardiales bacterium]|jgi:hypothetical protein|nr:exported protein of unknown function [Pseudonocardia sp.]MDT7652614.1 hypothetical protein [Pseudonocardiales bacterium]